MVAGLRHLTARPVAAYPMVAQGLFRVLYGVLALSTLLLYRRYFYGTDPDSDLFAPADYKRHVASVYALRALQAASVRAV